MIRHHKVVAALPTPLAADSVYYVRAGAGVDLYVTNSTGMIVSYKPNYQAANVNLDALAGLTGAADRVPYFTGVGALSLATLTAFGRSLLALADDPAARTLLKLSATDNVTFASLLFNANTKIYPESNGIKIQLGSPTAATGYITIKSTGELVLESAGLTVGGPVVPKTATVPLGSSAFPWSQAFVKTLTMSGAVNNAPPVTLDSATTPGTVAIGGVAANSVVITGTSNIASLGSTGTVGTQRTVRFTGVLTLVNSAALILPGAANLITSPGDIGVFELGPDAWRCVSWQRLDGQPAVTFSGGTLKSALNNAPQVTIASAGAIDAAGALANTIRITGTAYIGSLGSAPSGSKRTLIFDGAATLAVSTVMLLPGNANITAGVGDIAEMECEGLGAWRCVNYFKAKALPMIPGDFGYGLTTGLPLPGANADTALTNARYWTTSTWTGSPFTGTNGLNQGTLDVSTWNDGADYAQQIFTPINAANGPKRHRQKVAGVWQAWWIIPDFGCLSNDPALGNGGILSATTVSGFTVSKYVNGNIHILGPLGTTASLPANAVTDLSFTIPSGNIAVAMSSAYVSAVPTNSFDTYGPVVAYLSSLTTVRCPVRNGATAQTFALLLSVWGRWK